MPANSFFSYIRLEKNIFQKELARQLGTKGPAIGRYERDEMKPSIEAAAKMAAILDVSLDYPVGNSDIELDRKSLNRILELQKLPEDIKDKLYYFIGYIYPGCQSQTGIYFLIRKSVVLLWNTTLNLNIFHFWRLSLLLYHLY